MAGGLNLYGYAGGDPINFSDPFGLWPDPSSVKYQVSLEKARNSVIGRIVEAIACSMGCVEHAGGGLEVTGVSMPLPTGRLYATGPGASGQSPAISPREVAGKSPKEIGALARSRGLVPRGPDPMNGKGAYLDPATGCQRVLCHPNATPPHAHVNNPAGQRLDIKGNVVPAESPAAHLPIKP